MTENIKFVYSPDRISDRLVLMLMVLPPSAQLPVIMTMITHCVFDEAKNDYLEDLEAFEILKRYYEEGDDEAIKKIISEFLDSLQEWNSLIENINFD